MIQQIHKNTTTIYTPTTIKSNLNLFHLLKTTFLPQSAITKDYYNYQFYDSLQAFCSTFTNLLANQASIASLGVGDSSATVQNAASIWILKQGAGMIARILFVAMIGNKLDFNSKSWRYIADILNNISTLLLFLSVHFDRTSTIYIFCLANISSCICGVIANCTKSSLSNHFARSNNIADLNAKDDAQETIINLSTMITGNYMITKYLKVISIGYIPFETILVFSCFMLLHLYCNYLAVKSVVMDFPNIQRT